MILGLTREEELISTCRSRNRRVAVLTQILGGELSTAETETVTRVTAPEKAARCTSRRDSCLRAFSATCHAPYAPAGNIVVLPSSSSKQICENSTTWKEALGRVRQRLYLIPNTEQVLRQVQGFPRTRWRRSSSRRRA